jgi:phosphatidylserine/phosphatidylglycerophosphate/cardiolipin synthase-like enzyme
MSGQLDVDQESLTRVSGGLSGGAVAADVRSDPSDGKPEDAPTALAEEGGEVDVAFSPRPDGSAERLVIKAIDTARHSIEVAAYEFTSKPIADALIEAARRGVKVYLVADAKENDPGRGASRVTYAATGGVSARVDDVYAIMHNKFLVVDEETVETGSFNYTHAAGASNAENVVVLWRRPDIAALYVRRFRELWDESRPVGS